MEGLNEKKRGRCESKEAELEIYSPEVKRLRENLLDGFDDEVEFCAAAQDLDLFIKSFEEEIIASPSAVGGEAVELVDLTSDSGDSRPDLGYLLEASDDELGLPPTASSSSSLEGDGVTELVHVESDSSELGSEFWEVPGYDSFELGLGESESNYGSGNGEYVAIDGLFDYSDLGFGSGEEEFLGGRDERAFMVELGDGGEDDNGLDRGKSSGDEVVEQQYCSTDNEQVEATETKPSSNSDGVGREITTPDP
ncbi:hypothetical protein SASPL_140411 [Salvia splendens]|uniref:Uncharacterized protein n=1 Tax=Salvia splendens TaxID=180675 RepID=A0A8X8ZCG2_SALSN|nr:hypothetical protein SASPL_140411 [Salvia splendens]